MKASSVLDDQPGAPDTLPVPGAWLVDGEPMMPDLWGATEREDGRRLPLQAIPRHEALDAVLAMGAALPAEPTWRLLALCDPLVPLEPADLEPHPLEGAMQDNLFALQEVCQRPRSHITLRTARVPVGRARRIAAGATAWLAAHTEDWAHLTLDGIQPRRVLADVRDVDWDIYENRVAVRLVDHLLAWLRQKIARLRAYIGCFEDLKELQDEAGAEGSWRRRDRVFGLWGEASLETNRSHQVAGALQRLLRLQRKLDTLRDSQLVQAVPRRASVPDVLRPSNVLDHDPMYRRIAALWLAWAAQGRERTLDVERHAARQRKAFLDFGAFCRLLVVRALGQLGWEPEDEDVAVVTGAVIQVGPVRVEPLVGAVRLQVGGGGSLRLVPLLVELARAPERDVLVGALGQLGARSGEAIVILHLARGSELNEGAERLCGLAHEAPGRRVGLLPVSPWDISSTERVARAIRWHVLNARFRGWPVRVPQHPALPAGDWWRAAGREVEVVKAPGRRVLDAVRAEMEGARQRLDGLEAERDGVKEAAANARDDRRQLKEANERSKRLNEQIQAKRSEVDALVRLVDQLASAQHRLEELSRCPVCEAQGKEVTARLTAWEKQTFRAECDGCRARWGMLPCGCGQRVPFLRSAGAPESAGGVGSVDRSHGQDVLAVPLGDRFLCPGCGEAVG